jgi:hypothetical protein
MVEKVKVHTSKEKRTIYFAAHIVIFICRHCAQCRKVLENKGKTVYYLTKIVTIDLYFNIKDNTIAIW